MESLKFKKWIFHKYQECTWTNKSKNLIFQKYQQSTRTSILGQMIGHSLQNIFDSLGFAYAFAFCQNNGSLKIFQNVFWKKSFKNTKRYQSFGGIPKQHIKICWGSVRPKLRFVRSSRKLKYEKICLRMIPCFSCICLNIFVIKSRCKGPLQVQKSQDFGTSQNHPKSIGI